MSASPVQLTRSARRATSRDLPVVVSRGALARHGLRSWDVRRQLEAGRWQQRGRAIVRHNGAITADERATVALVNCGPRSLLTAFTALEIAGLRSWSRVAVHVLAPAGVAHPGGLGFPIRLHRTSGNLHRMAGRRVQRTPPAAVLAASTLATPRVACGLLAAVVQQRLARPAQLRDALDAAPRVRHRRAMILALDDISLGAHALGEIDLRRLCRRYDLPLPAHQAIRLDRWGRRRYLDAEWVRADGRRVAGEVDGALHQAPLTWSDDLLRHNELTISDTPVLRWPPPVLVRHEQPLVADQLRRALGI